MPTEVVDWGDCRVGVDVGWDEFSIENAFIQFWEFDESYDPIEVTQGTFQFRESNGLLNLIDLISSNQALQFRLANGALSNISIVYEGD